MVRTTPDDNKIGSSASGNGYTSSEYLNAGIPLASSFGPTTNSFKPKMNDVVANTSDAGDSHGGYNMTDFGGYTYDTFWTRHMVLLKEGGLIVLNSVTPTALAGGWLLWAGRTGSSAGTARRTLPLRAARSSPLRMVAPGPT